MSNIIWYTETHQIPCDGIHTESDSLAEILTLNLTIREGDGLSVYRNHDGELHRVHGPACTTTSGFEMWYLNGKLHREDGPAISGPGIPPTWAIHGDILTYGMFVSQIWKLRFKPHSILTDADTSFDWAV